MTAEDTLRAIAGQRPMVLVADDDDGIRYLLATVVERVGLGVLLAGDGDVAIRLASEHRQALCCAILDFRMPIVDGISAAQAIRAAHPELPIFMMSAAFPSDYQQRLAALGIDHVLCKPFALAELRALLRPFSGAVSPPLGRWRDVLPIAAAPERTS